MDLTAPPPRDDDDDRFSRKRCRHRDTSPTQYLPGGNATSSWWCILPFFPQAERKKQTKGGDWVKRKKGKPNHPAVCARVMGNCSCPGNGHIREIFWDPRGERLVTQSPHDDVEIPGAPHTIGHYVKELMTSPDTEELDRKAKEFTDRGFGPILGRMFRCDPCVGFVSWAPAHNNPHRQIRAYLWETVPSQRRVEDILNETVQALAQQASITAARIPASWESFREAWNLTPTSSSSSSVELLSASNQFHTQLRELQIMYQQIETIRTLFEERRKLRVPYCEGGSAAPRPVPEARSRSPSISSSSPSSSVSDVSSDDDDERMPRQAPISTRWSSASSSNSAPSEDSENSSVRIEVVDEKGHSLLSSP